jgi:PhoH-like ATPase
MSDPKDTHEHLFILDTNVLMHDPGALFRFQDNHIYLPMVVLEELDAAKKGMSEVARNVRQVSRILDELIENADKEAIEQGILLPSASHSSLRGRLFFQTRPFVDALPPTLPGNNPDNTILGTALQLKLTQPDRAVILVSKDINLRIKAHILGISAEDYYDDKIVDDINLLYGGSRAFPDNTIAHRRQREECWIQEGRTLWRLPTLPPPLFPNQCLYTEDDQPLHFIVRDLAPDAMTVELVRDYHSQRDTVWGINARNREQNFALNLLMDPDIDFVTLLGQAGTGKTLLALAAGLTQTLEDRRYREIVMTRATVPVGEDIGFLPGTEEEKMTPWMGALMDNLEVLTRSQVGGEWGRAATNDLVQHRIKIGSLNFMRGRTFLNRFLIIDEAQNLTSKQMRTLITRAGPGTKIVCLGNLAQIDTPYLSETTSGLTYVVDRFKDWAHSGHITLKRGERSRLADFAGEVL